MKVTKVVTIICVALVLALPSMAAKASLGTVDIEHSGYGAHGTAQVWGGGQYGTSVYAGVYMLDKTAGTGEGNIWPNYPDIGSFCIELHQYAPNVTTTYQVVMPEEVYNGFLGQLIGTAKADYIRELWGRFHAESITSNSKAEAFAAAIWEIIYEDLPTPESPWDVTSGSGFRAKSIDAVLANSWLQALTGCGPKADLRAFVNCYKQDYIVEVPEPATIALLGLSGLMGLLRRKRVSL